MGNKWKQQVIDRAQLDHQWGISKCEVLISMMDAVGVSWSHRRNIILDPTRSPKLRIFQNIASIFHEILSESKIYCYLTVLTLILNAVVFIVRRWFPLMLGVYNGIGWHGQAKHIFLAYHFRHCMRHVFSVFFGPFQSSFCRCCSVKYEMVTI